MVETWWYWFWGPEFGTNAAILFSSVVLGWFLGKVSLLVWPARREARDE